MAALKVPPAPTNTAAILLAAGASARFGGDKLAALLKGGSILGASAKALAEAGCYLQTAIVSKTTFAQDQLLNGLDFDVTVNPHAERGISTSIWLGVAWAKAHGAEAVLIALADMPFITPEHYEQLFEKAAASESGIAYSMCGERRSPPAIFTKTLFPELLALEGDRGAHRLLQSAPAIDGVEAPEAMLADIDTREDIARLKR